MERVRRDVQSRFSVKDSIDRLAVAVAGKGLTVFARIDHGGGATEAGLALRPTELLVFGSARGGTPLMQLDQTVGLDLPLKILAWEDSAGIVWLSYEDPHVLIERHGLGPPAQAAADALEKMLASLTGIAAGTSGST